MLARATLATLGSRAVPAFPGATNTLATRGDCASFHASACSRPPPPITRTFTLPASLGTSIECDLAEEVEDAAVVDAAAEIRDVRAHHGDTVVAQRHERQHDRKGPAVGDVRTRDDHRRVPESGLDE